MKPVRFILVVAVLAGSVAAPSAQDELRSWILDHGVAQLCFLEDLDGDGLDDLLVADPEFGGDLRIGAVFVLSTRAVAPGEAPVVLCAHQGTHPFEHFGSDIEVLGDVDGRGGDDYAISGRIFDGASGALLLDVEQRFGLGYTRLEAMDDLDHDGDAEILFRDGDAVGLLLGGDFEPKFRARSSAGFDVFEFHRLADVDGDGVTDFVVGSAYNDDMYFSGPLDVFSGATGKLLYTAQGPYEWPFHDSVFLPGDWSGDGVPDLIHGGALLDGQSGVILARSLSIFAGANAGDLDGDGFEDFFVGARVIGGRTRTELFGVPQFESAGTFGADRRDWNRDGFPDLWLFRPSTRELRILSGAPAGVRALGEPCSAARERTPRIGQSGLPQLGRALEFHLSGLDPGVDALLLIGAPNEPARSFGSGCTIGVALPSIHPARTVTVRPGVAVASVGFTIPADLALAGTHSMVQWIVPSTGTAPLASTRLLELSLSVPADFPMLVRGTVRSVDGTPLPGAVLQVLGEDATGVSGTDGGFEFFVPPHLSATRLLASLALRGLSGWSEPFASGPGATIDLGDVALDASRKMLVLGEGSGSSALAAALRGERVPPGVLVADELPPDPALFELIWHVRREALDARSSEILAAYVRAGGGLHLSGVRFTQTGSRALQTLINALVLAGGVQVGLNNTGPYAFHPAALGSATTLPNVLGQWRTGTGGAASLTGIAEANTLVTASLGAAGALWSPTELAGGRGRLTLLLGTSWLTLPDMQEIVENLRAFLRQGPRARAAQR